MTGWPDPDAPARGTTGSVIRGRPRASSRTSRRELRTRPAARPDPTSTTPGPMATDTVRRLVLDAVTLLPLASGSRDVPPALVRRLTTHPGRVADLRPGGTGRTGLDDRELEATLGLLHRTMRLGDRPDRRLDIHQSPPPHQQRPHHDRPDEPTSGNHDNDRIAMTLHHEHGSNPEIDEAVRLAGIVWRDHGCRIADRGPERRSVRLALMEARRAGASWQQLGEEVGLDAADLRDLAGCMPRHGRRPEERERRHGRGARRPERHMGHEGHECEGRDAGPCGGGHGPDTRGHRGCDEYLDSECGGRHRERRRARNMSEPGW